MSNFKDRIVILVDMDCFYCQVEENLAPNLKGKPIAVVQYNAWMGGGIIAVNYPARDRGVTRHMRGNEAKKHCPEIELVRVPNVRGKADLTKYRDAGKKVAEVLQMFTTLLERASVDEAYLDITEEVNKRLQSLHNITSDLLRSTHIVGFENVNEFLYQIYDNEDMNECNLKLAVGAVIAEEVRAAVFEKTGYKCSAGIAHNKTLAKLVCGLHKPNQQTVLPKEGVPILFENLSVKKVRSLGGKFGDQLSEKLNIKNMGELIQFSEQDLRNKFDDKTASWLYNIARGIDSEPVTIRLVSKSIGCCKKFPGRTALKTNESINHWLNELSIEISERLEKDTEENNRKPKQMVISFAQQVGRKDVSSTRTIALNSYEVDRIKADAFEVIKKCCQQKDGGFCLKFLGISVGKFEEIKSGNNDIASMFKNLLEQSKVNEESENSSLSFNNALKNEEVNENNLSVLPTDLSNNSESDEKIVQSDDSNDSISGEMKAESSGPSFFQQYLGGIEEEPTRNFDTSLVLDTNDGSCNDDDADIETSVVPTTSSDNFNPRDFDKLCPDCNKKIPVYEMVAHMDYHLALKIVRDEADLYKPKPINNNVKVINKSPKKKSNKRKNDSNSMKMTSFLQPKIGEDVATKTCSECNRKVPIEEVNDHMDYHMAKKLHLELNPVIKVQCDKIKVCDKSDKGICKNKKQGIASFFKNI